MIARQDCTGCIDTRLCFVGRDQRLDDGVQRHGFILVCSNNQHRPAGIIWRISESIKSLAIVDQFADHARAICSRQHLQGIAIGDKARFPVRICRENIRHDTEIRRSQPSGAGNGFILRARGEGCEAAHGVPDQDQLVRMGAIGLRIGSQEGRRGGHIFDHMRE